ncbi:hypothetical protein Gpo141_00007459 [Globisporangium polare]
MSFVACGWDSVAEVASSPECASVISWRTLLLILPQSLMLLAYILQVVITLRYNKRAHSLVIIVTILLLPLGVAALIHSGFRASLGLCCCNNLLCPITSPNRPLPKSASCSLVVRNCYMAFMRKIAHFVGTTALIAPLTSLIFTTLSGIAQRFSSHSFCRKFMQKTRI